MTGPSAHLSWSELACHDGTAYPLNWRADRAVVLAAEFEAIRHACGDVPIVVLSAYRTRAYNRAVNGAQFSQHMDGRALDLKAPPNVSLVEFEAIMRRRAKVLGSRLKGLGVYPTFLHMDVRPSPSLVVWIGTRPQAEVKGST